MKLTIEMRLSKNGAIIWYVDGKRVCREAAVKFARENNLPTYAVVCYAYTRNVNYEEFATALSAYMWLVRKCKSIQSISDANPRIVREETFFSESGMVTTTHEEIYHYSEWGERINADDEPEFATFIYAKPGEVEAAIEDYAVSTEAQDAAVDAEIKQAAAIKDEPETTEIVRVNIEVNDYFNADDEDDRELLAELEREIEWLPDIVRYRIDAELGICVTVSDHAAICAVEKLFDKYGLNHSRYICTENITTSALVDADPHAENESEDDFELYPIDIAIYHGGDILTDDELEDYAAQFRKAITANGNFGTVEIGESYLSVYGNTGGDNKTIWKLIGDLCWRGDCCLEAFDAEYPHECREMPGEEIDAMLARMGIDNDTPAEIDARIDGYLNTAYNLEGMAEELEIICDNFDDDARDEKDWHVASRISFYVEHVKRGIEGLREMIDWYIQHADFAESKAE